jgi:microcystin-dependent protein
VADPYIGEIRIFGGTFAPIGWSFCNGQSMSISENNALFNLIGTTYGGDGISTFNLPNLQSRLPIGMGNGYVMGQQAGEENHTLTGNETPSHVHTVSALTTATVATPASGVYGGATTVAIYEAASSAQMNAGMVSPNTGGQPHSNMMPYLAINFIISLEGIYPSQG